MATTLRMGIATADVTPDWPISLAGFAARTEPAQGVSQPLKVRVAVLESAQTNGTVERTVLVVADLLWWGEQQVPALRQELAAIVGTTAEAVLLSATHTHSGPQTAVRASVEIGVADERFLALLWKQTVAATREALAGLEQVQVSRVVGSHEYAFNRRYPLNPAGPVDPALTVIQAVRDDGSLLALFVHFTCHPVITQEPLVSSEFCGVAMDRLEADLGGTAFYLQGCCGDINPSEPGGTASVRGTHTEVERLGLALATSVRALLATGEAESLVPMPLRAVELSVDLPFAAVPGVAELRDQAVQPGVVGEVGRAMLDHPEWVTPAIPLRLQRLDLAEGWSVLAITGEVVVEFGLQVRARSGGAVLPMGYANGMTGYIPSVRILAEGGYEATGSTPYFMLPAPFDPAVETIVRAAIERLVPSVG